MSDTSHNLSSLCCCCSDLEFHMPRRANPQLASCSHGWQTREEIVSRHLFVAAVLTECWKSRVPHEIILLSLIGYKQELNIPHNHLLILTLTYTDTIAMSTCFKEAIDKKTLNARAYRVIHTHTHTVCTILISPCLHSQIQVLIPSIISEPLGHYCTSWLKIIIKCTN